MSRPQTMGPSIVWRFEIPIVTGDVIKIPMSAAVIKTAIDIRTPQFCVSIWVLLPIDADGKPCSPVNRRFEVFGTGHVIPGGLVHVGSAIDTVGRYFVWHVFEKRERN